MNLRVRNQILSIETEIELKNITQSQIFKDGKQTYRIGYTKNPKELGLSDHSCVFNAVDDQGKLVLNVDISENKDEVKELIKRVTTKLVNLQEAETEFVAMHAKRSTVIDHLIGGITW